VARSGERYAINLAPFVRGKLISEHRHVCLPEKTGDRAGWVTRPRQASGEAFHRISFSKAALYAHLAFGTVRSWCRPSAADDEGSRGKSGRGSTPACDRSLLRG
jgi:hypothetical protein